MDTRSGSLLSAYVIGAVVLALLLPGALVAPSYAAPPGASAREPSQQHRSGLPWSSGVAPADISGENAEQFGVDRGAPVDNVSVYPGRASWRAMLSTFWTQALPSYFDPARDDLVVAVPLWPASRSVRKTGTDDNWTDLGANIARSDPNAYVRLGWEMNIKANHWSLRPSNARPWVKAFRRAAGLIATTCPACQIVWNPNRGLDQSGTSSRAAFARVKDYVDVYAIDDYDIYPPIKNAESRRRHINGFGQWNESLKFAQSHAMKLAVPEWGVACNGPGCQWRGNAGGDNPRYIRAFMQWFEKHATSIAFETYFDEPARTSRSALYTNPIGPRAGRAYRDEIAAVLGR